MYIEMDEKKKKRNEQDENETKRRENSFFSEGGYVINHHHHHHHHHHPYFKISMILFRYLYIINSRNLHSSYINHPITFSLLVLLNRRREEELSHNISENN